MEKQKDRKKRSIILSIVFFTIPLIAYGVIAFAMGTLFPFVVVSDNPSSMSPTMEYGDVALIKHVPGRDIKVGDIIVFSPVNWSYTVSTEIIHRVIDIVHNESGYWFRTKGDANPYPDQPPNPWVHESLVRGKVILIIPKIGLISLFLSQGGIIIVVIILVIWIVIESFRENSQTAKGKNSRSNHEILQHRQL